MSKITKQLSVYNTSTQSWSTPVDLGADAENVTYKETNVYDELELVDDHLTDLINTAEGVHGIRYYQDQLQSWTGEEWETISSGGGTDIPIGDVTGATASTSGDSITLTWTDPDDVVISGITFAEWAGTVVVKKVGSAPNNVTDGTIVIDEVTRNQYSSTGYQDSGLSYDITYYYRFFPYKLSGTVRKYTDGSSVSAVLTKTVIPNVPSFKSNLTYNGNAQTVTDVSYWNNYDPTQLTIDGEVSKTNAGTYTATFTPKTGYMWSDTTVTAKEVSWTIGQQSVTVPVFTNTSLTFNGSSQGPTITPKELAKVRFTNDTASHAGSYTLTAALIDDDNYKWSTGGTAQITQAWTIATKKVTLPTVTGSFTYDGTEKEATVSEFSAADITQTGIVAATNAGTYTVTFNLINESGYSDRVWIDTETIVARTRTWTISPKSVTKPVMGSNLTYNGSSRNAPIGTYDSNEITVTGDTTGTNAGTYTVYYNLTSTNNYIWYDDTTAQKSDTWTIEKADGYVTVSADTVNLSADLMTTTVNITSKSGTATISNSDLGIATSSLSGDVITINAVSNGTATITVNIAATNNYKATSKNITVNVSLLEIVTFADGTDEEIKAMLDAYYADEITWEEMGWSVGDTRLIHLNSMSAPNPNSSQTWVAQDITIVIVAHDHTDLATAINGHTKACITVQTREVLNNNTSGYNTSGHIYVNGGSSYDTTFTKWSNLYMRTYLNNTVLGAIPSGDFKNAIKSSSHYRHTTYNGTASEQVTDTLFLPSYPEIFGTASYSNYVATNPVEGTQFAYYTTTSNRVKYGNNNGTSNGTAQYWWEGSASSNYTSSTGYRWCGVNTNGAVYIDRGDTAFGLAPAFAM